MLKICYISAEAEIPFYESKSARDTFLHLYKAAIYGWSPYSSSKKGQIDGCGPEQNFLETRRAPRPLPNHLKPEKKGLRQHIIL